MKVKELLNEPTKWTKHYLARNNNGDFLYPTDSEATSFCLLGAIIRCYYKAKDEFNARRLVLNYIQQHKGAYTDIEHYNDDEGTFYSDIREIINAIDI